MSAGRRIQKPIQIDEQAENDEVHAAVDDPVAAHDPVVIPDGEPNQPPAASDPNDRHPYVRVVHWVYNEVGGMGAELQWSNSVVPSDHLTDEDRAEAKRLSRLHRAQRRA
ncbi:unnamed protein product [Phytophthora fragariaefolia]|uniref:Unnamed protein product n=1 Tax=Phytophthora fragariaefolia TaxID=1490495 RepID=A0A9W6TQQ2_9STRA|nr:unnamed protein product [Phytophthora fragariaefolia]